MPDELTDDMVKAFDVEKPFTYSIVFDFEPKLRWTQPYKGLKVCHLPFRCPQIDFLNSRGLCFGPD